MRTVCLGQLHAEVMPARRMSGRLVSTAVCTISASVTGCRLQRDLPAHHARHVQQIVDEPHEMAASAAR